MESDPNDMLRKTPPSRYPLAVPRRFQSVAMVWAAICLLGLATAVIKPIGGLVIRTTAHLSARRFVRQYTQRQLRWELLVHGLRQNPAKITAPAKHAVVFRRFPRVRRSQSGIFGGFGSPETIRGSFPPSLLPLRAQAPHNARYTPLPFRPFAAVSSRAPPFFV